MSRFSVIETGIKGVKILERKPIKDDRGFFERMYCANDLKNIVKHEQVVQINQSYSLQSGTLRGLHYQLPPSSENKIVSCLKGRIFDVAVDLRSSSSTYLQWFGVELSDCNQRSLVIPQGCAHGYQTLEDDTLMIYFVTNYYDASMERGVNPFDPRLNISWPVQVSDISKKDQDHPMIDEAFEGVLL